MTASPKKKYLLANSMPRLLLYSFCIFLLLCSMRGVAQKKSDNLKVWVGYIMELSQIQQNQLPRVFNVQVALLEVSPGRWKGVISKFWEKHYHTIASISGSFNAKSESFNLIEKEFLRSTPSISESLCLITTTLKQVKIEDKVVMQGRYYGVNNNEKQPTPCPVGLIHLEKPFEGELAYKHLLSYLEKNTPTELQKDVEDVQLLGFSFPKVTISTVPFYNLQNSLKYNVQKLAKFQKIGVRKTIEWSESKLKLIVQSSTPNADTINVLLDGLTMASNHKLTLRSPVDISMEFEAQKAVHEILIVPFSRHKKSNKLNLILLKGDGSLHKRHTIDYQSNENVEIALYISIDDSKR